MSTEDGTTAAGDIRSAAIIDLREAQEAGWARTAEAPLRNRSASLGEHANRLADSERHLIELWGQLVEVDPMLAGRVAHAAKAVRRAITALEPRSFA